MPSRLLNGPTPVLLGVLVASALSLAACQGAASARCRSDTELGSDRTPVQLSLDTIQCVRRGNWIQASLHFGVAKTFSLFDAQREERMGQAARQGWPGPMLPALIIREQLDPGQVRRLQDEIRSLSENPVRHRQLCNLLRRLGPPTYPPDYRVDQRWEVSFPPQATSTKPSEAAKATWREILSRQVACGPGV
jgi:hypothetical protein